jgi:hypothetical protein
MFDIRHTIPSHQEFYPLLHLADSKTVHPQQLLGPTVNLAPSKVIPWVADVITSTTSSLTLHFVLHEQSKVQHTYHQQYCGSVYIRTQASSFITLPDLYPTFCVRIKRVRKLISKGARERYLYSDSILEKMFSSKRPAMVSIAGMTTRSFCRLTRRMSSKHLNIEMRSCSGMESR